MASPHLEDMRRLADQIVSEIGRPVARGTGETCRRFVAGKTTEDEIRDLVRELLRNAAENK